MLPRNRFLERDGKIGQADVLEIDRTRIFFVPVPWRMAFDGMPVSVRQAPPSDEAHHVAVVEHQNGGPLAGECREDGVQGGVVNGWKRRGVLEPFGEPEQCRLLFAAARQRLLGFLALADVMLNADRVTEVSRCIAHTGGRNLRPDVGAVLAGQTLFNGVAIDFARDLSPELRKILRDVLWRGLVKDGTAKQVGRFVAHQFADLLVDAEHPSGLIDLDDAHADMFVDDGQPVFIPTQPIFARNSGDVRSGG